LKDTNHFLNITNDFTFTESSENNILFTMDIKGLYTNIPNEYGLRALKKVLEKRTIQIPSTSTILKLAELVLTENYFKFNDQYYQQTGGTMMGTPFGPEYACLSVGQLEEDIFKTYKGPVPQLRYIDDIFGASSNTLEELQTFIDFI
jgi:hypothetical protein